MNAFRSESSARIREILWRLVGSIAVVFASFGVFLTRFSSDWIASARSFAGGDLPPATRFFEEWHSMFFTLSILWLMIVLFVSAVQPVRRVWLLLTLAISCFYSVFAVYAIFAPAVVIIQTI